MVKIIKNCVICDKEMLIVPSVGRTRKTCSNACKGLLHRVVRKGDHSVIIRRQKEILRARYEQAAENNIGFAWDNADSRIWD